MTGKLFKRTLCALLAALLVVPNVSSSLYAKQTLSYESLKDVVEKNKEEVKTTLDNYKEDDVVNFIVVLEDEPLLDRKANSISLKDYLVTSKGSQALKALEKQQASVKQDILSTRAKGLKVEYTYKYVLNGFAVSAQYKEKENLASIEGVKAVYVAQTYDYVEPVNGYVSATRTSGNMMDSDRANEEGYTGKGTVTAVLDTGLDVNHRGFANDPESPRFTPESVENAIASGKLKAKGESASDLYVSAKIPFAYDYADKDNNVADSQGHGTHVSGSVGADCSEFSGVAPDTQIVSMKVFSDTQAGADDSWILAALEDCVLLDVDAINMSLGVGAGFTREADEYTNDVYDRVKAQGINLMAAAGNDTSSAYGNAYGYDMNLVTNPDNGVVGSPSTYNAAMSVASINEEIVYNEYFKVGENKISFNDAASDDKLFIPTFDGQTIEYVVIPGFGVESDFESVDVKGKIALVARGSIAFTEKEANAKAAGAIALICFNNVDGEAVNMQSGGLLPMISITKADGKIMREAEVKEIVVSKEFAQDTESVVGGEMSDFSNLGVAPDMSLKPEITAPGGNVYSTTVGDKFGNMSGTSMASPHMAGAAALMRQYVNEKYPTYTSVQKQALVNNLLMSTANPVSDPDGVLYTPRKQGSGLAQIYNAIHTNAYLTVNGDRPKAQLGDNEEGKFNFTFTIHNTSDKELTFDLSTVALTAKEEIIEDTQFVSESSRVLGNDEITVEYSQEQVKVSANGETKVDVTLTLSDKAKENLKDFTNGTFIDGFLYVTPTDENEVTLSLPFLGYYGDWAKAPIFDYTLYDDEQYSTFEASGLYQFNILTGDGVPYGFNYVNGEVDENKIAVASRSLEYDRVFPVLGMHRASKTTQYVVTNDKNEVVYENVAYNQAKSFYYSSGGFFTYAMPEEGWAPIVFDEDGYYSYLPDGQYYFTVNGTIDGEKGVSDSITFPIYVDNEKPVIKERRFYEENGVKYLEFTLSDNHYLMGAQLADETGEGSLSEPVAFSYDEAGSEVKLLFDLTAALNAGYTVGTLYMMDYALNETLSEVFSLTSQDMEVSLVKVNQQQVTASIDSIKPIQYSATCYPETAIDKTVTWSSSNEKVATIDAVSGLITIQGPGESEIRATANNGVYGTSILTIVDSSKDLPTDLKIVKDGTYKLPKDLSGTITITDAAKYVTLVGHSENTSENPYVNLAIDNQIENLNLTLQDVNIKTGKSVVVFKGNENTLKFKGSNSFVADKYTSKGLFSVNDGVSLNVIGNGKVDITIGSSTYAAGIGADAGKAAGNITFDGPTLTGTTIGSGSIIGGSGYGFGKITIESGKLDVAVPFSEAGYGGNLSTCGAAIGDGNCSYKTASGTIVINGGTISGYSEVQAAVIGTGHKSTTKVNVTINGGKLDLKSLVYKGATDTTVGGACIGTGDQSQALGSLTINGGEIIAYSETAAAALGGGAGTNGTTTYINGGTVTAISAREDINAVGAGIYPQGGNGSLMISGGSFKANNLPFTSIVNDDYDEVKEVLVPASDVQAVVVDGKDFKVSANHPEDENLHLWLSVDEHDVKVTSDEDVLNFEVKYKASKVQVKQYFNVEYDLTDLTCDGSVKAYKGEDYKAKLSAVEGKGLPTSVNVTMNDTTNSVAVDQASGEFVVEKVSGDLKVSASASDLANKDALVKAIEEAGKVNKADYTDESVINLEAALSDAETVRNKEDATQDEVDAATKALNDAMKALVEKPVVNKAELEKAIEEASKVNKADYTDESVINLETALSDAETIRNKEDATQDEVDAATKALNDAMKALVEKPVVNKAELEKAIDEASKVNKADYTDESVINLETALSDAEVVLNKDDATQAEVDAATKALNDAMKALVKKPVVNKAELEKAIEEAGKVDTTNKTAESVAALTSAITSAKEVLADEKATQADVDAAVKALNDAVANLKDIEVKPEYKGYDDVDSEAWYADMVKEATIKGLMGRDGNVGNNFNPDGKITRGMVATVLYRMAGEPKVTYSDKFSDVKDGLWYSNGIVWASEAKVVSGYANGKFGPDDAIKREDFAIMLRNYANACGLDTKSNQSLETFKDYKAVSAYAKDAIAWCVENGLMSGSKKGEETYLNPGANTTRAEAAKMFVQLSNLIKK